MLVILHQIIFGCIMLSLNLQKRLLSYRTTTVSSAKNCIYTLVVQAIQQQQSQHTLASRRVVLCVPGIANTRERSNGVVARCLCITRAGDAAFVDVVLTISTSEAGRTLSAARRFVARGGEVFAVTIAETILAPFAARTRCKIFWAACIFAYLMWCTCIELHTDSILHMLQLSTIVVLCAY